MHRIDDSRNLKLTGFFNYLDAVTRRIKLNVYLLILRNKLQILRYLKSETDSSVWLVLYNYNHFHLLPVLPNIKPRKSVIKLPSLSENDDEPPAKKQKSEEGNRLSPVPSTSELSPKSKAASTIAKIQVITNEIRNLSNIPKKIEGKSKRPLDLSAVGLIINEIKKQKLEAKTHGNDSLSESPKDICLQVSDVANTKLD